MKTGIDLIAEERAEQLVKHKRTIAEDVVINAQGQLSAAARVLAQKDIPDEIKDNLMPKGWDIKLWDKMISKPYRDRLIIAGALIAAEIDRIDCGIIERLTD